MSNQGMFEALLKINHRPEPFACYTAVSMWNDPYVSQKMLTAHLDQSNDVASRNKEVFDKSVEWMTKRFNIGEKTRICDFGCGPGLYTAQFAERGASVIGIDFSERSIDYAQKSAKQKNLNIDHICQDYLQFSTNKRFDLIIMIQHDFCALSPEQRKSLLSKFHEFLEEGGTVLLDVFSIPFFNATPKQALYEQSSDKDFWSNFWSDNPYYVFNNTFKYEEEKLLLHKHTIIEEMRTREIFNWLQCYSLEALKSEIQNNGFNVIEHYSDITGKPYEPDSTEIAIVATKA